MTEWKDLTPAQQDATIKYWDKLVAGDEKKPDHSALTPFQKAAALKRRVLSMNDTDFNKAVANRVWRNKE